MRRISYVIIVGLGYSIKLLYSRVFMIQAPMLTIRCFGFEEYLEEFRIYINWRQWVVQSYEKIFKFLYPYHPWDQLLTALLRKARSTNCYSGQNLPNRRNISKSSFGNIMELSTTGSIQNSLDRQKETKVECWEYWNCFNRKLITRKIEPREMKLCRLRNDIRSQKACCWSGYQAIVHTLLVQTGRGIFQVIADQVSSLHSFTLSSGGWDERFCETSG